MEPPRPEQLMREWQQALATLGRSAFGDAELAERLLAPMRTQAALVEEGLAQQRALQRELADRLTEPLRRSDELLDEAARSMRTQAGALRRASVSLAEVAGLLEDQAALVERASAAMRQGADALAPFTGPAGGSDG